jgi:hypothetical protein
MTASLSFRIIFFALLSTVPPSLRGTEPFLSLHESDLKLKGVNAAQVTYRGKPALKLTEASQSDDLTIAIVKNVSFENGTIEAEVSGAPAAGAFEGARGFVGIAFRVQPEARQFECLYLRPANGRAPDQLRRNHSAQYISYPDYPWERLRKEDPGKYETYVDLQPGVWTKIRIVVSGSNANLYVNGAEQPALIVNDLKLSSKPGQIALWIGPGTEAYFADLRVTPAQ